MPRNYATEREYTTFRIPKRRGGFRVIEAPNDELKERQRKDLPFIRETYPVSPFAHGFMPYRNIVTMAMPHVGKDWIMSIDIKDFFPSVTLDLFVKYSEPASKSNVARQEVHATHFAKFGHSEPRLPQGAPGSPHLSNSYLFRFDWRLAWKCYQLGCDYSRYADDIVISGDERNNVLVLYKITEHLLGLYGLKVNKAKVRLMSKANRQLVCGVVVNEKLNLPRKWRKNLRAEIYQQEGGELRQDTKGRIAFRGMVLESEKTTWASTEIINSIVASKKFKKSLEGK